MNAQTEALEMPNKQQLARNIHLLHDQLVGAIVDREERFMRRPLFSEGYKLSAFQVKVQ